ncbi:MAG: hypothetical protein VKK04_02440 [Synechococcales bacterium]|nr:hypothetical protein [Synechococcales bacterium]
MTLPAIIHESFLQLFNFHHRGCVHKATLFQKVIYAQFQTFHTVERDQAYRLSFEMMGQGYCTLITFAPHAYTVWVDIRALDRFPHLVSDAYR